MLLLALDTATDKGLLALVEDETTLVEYSLESAGTFLSRLLPGMAAMFAGAGREPADLGAVGVSLGPGNFTGLRIGLATAKTLAWALGCPLVPVPTMEVLAAQFPFQPRPIGVVLDAKRQEVFWGVYRCPADRPQLVVEPIRLPISELSRRLSPPLVLTGFLAGLPPILLQDGIVLAPAEMRHSRAPTLARLAKQRLEMGLSVPPQQLAPTYLRPAL